MYNTINVEVSGPKPSAPLLTIKEIVEQLNNLLNADYAVLMAGEERPTDCKVGTQFFDTTLGKPIWWNGEIWVDAMGNNADAESTPGESEDPEPSEPTDPVDPEPSEPTGNNEGNEGTENTEGGENTGNTEPVEPTDNTEPTENEDGETTEEPNENVEPINE